MQAYIRIFILCVVPGIISWLIHKRINKRIISTSISIKTFVFYTVIFYITLSLIKTISGKGSITLLEGFSEVSQKTYLHHSIPLILLSIALPLITKKFFQEKSENFISLAVSVITGICTVSCLVFDEISSLLCSCIMLISLLLAFMIYYTYKKEIKYFTYQSIKGRLVLVVPTILFWIVLMVLYLPNELYLGNINDMEIPYGNFIYALSLGSIIYFILYTILLVYLLSEKQLHLVCNLIFSITFAGYLQCILLNGKMDILDGAVQEWSAASKLFNACIWIVVITVIVFLPYFIKKNIEKLYSLICIYISLIQLVSWGYMGITAESLEKASNYELTTEARLELNPEHNVLVFVLDWFDQQIEEKILDKDPDFSEALKDFTWYKNMTSLYAFTDMSIPYLLTNVEWQYDMEEKEYRDYAYQNTSLLPDIAKANYDIGIYTYNYYLTEDVKNIVLNYTNTTIEGWNSPKILKQMIRCSKYKSYPFSMKDTYWYYADSNFFSTLKSQTTTTLNPGDDNQFYQELLSQGIHINKTSKYDGAYRFYHLVGAHPPFEPDMVTKGKNCMSMVYEYLEQLKNLGLYDNATIIITADHGHNYMSGGYEERLGTYDLKQAGNPILFVKKANQTNTNGPVISMAPVSHSEMAATIMKSITKGSTNYGNTFSDISENTDRERYYIFRRHDDIPYEKYLITNDANDWNNWKLEQ